VLKTSVEGRLPLVMQLEVMAPLLQRGTPLSGMGGSAGGDRAQSDWALYRRLDCPVTESVIIVGWGLKKASLRQVLGG